MTQRSIKLFLGGYINNTNAQNLNCLALARHLDKIKFKVYTLELYSGNLESQKGKIQGIKIFNCFKPFKISKYLGFLWGIWHCDIAYLPKGELTKWNAFLVKIFNKKSLKTVEGIYDHDNLESALAIYGNYETFVKSFSYYNKVYSITSYLANFNKIQHGITCETKPLYLGCEISTFLNKKKPRGQLTSIIYIGRLKERKGVYNFVELARLFTNINFLIFGNGEEQENLANIIERDKLENLTLNGVISHNELAKILQTIDLHILPSRSEGFPKVTLETAAAGVPSLVYGDYGADEWITHNHNGFVVNTLEQMIATVAKLQKEPELLKLNSKNAVALAKQFDWEVLIKDWEMEIIKIHES